MSVNGIAGALSSYVQKVTSGDNFRSGATSAPSSALQEAQETPQTTAQEAAHGDRQAIAKLAREQEQSQQNSPATEPGKGTNIDHTA